MGSGAQAENLAADRIQDQCLGTLGAAVDAQEQLLVCHGNPRIKEQNTEPVARELPVARG
ncbi:hypothetical protein D3C76_1692490 [compost metagenome]